MTIGQENFTEFASSNVLSTSFIVGYDSAANVEKKFPASAITSYIQGSLPVASSTQLGAVMTGAGLTMNGSTLSANVLSVNGATGAVVVQAVNTSTSSGFSLISNSGAAGGTIGIRQIVGAQNVVVQNDAYNNLQVGVTPTPSFNRVLINTVIDDGTSAIQSGGQVSTVNASNVIKTYGQAQGFTVQASGGSQTSPSAIASGTQLGTLQISGYNGSNYTQVASIAAYSDGAYTTSSTPSDLRFYTTPVSSTTQFERMRVSPAGNLLIASTTDNGNQLQVTGNATVSAGLTAGTLTATTSVSAATGAFTGLVTAATPTAGTNNTQVATTAFVSSLIASGNAASIATNGYQKLPSGLIIQWSGSFGTPSGGSATWTFPLAFPNACLAAFGTARTASGIAILSVKSALPP
jgi:hypothetical protein